MTEIPVYAGGSLVAPAAPRAVYPHAHVSEGEPVAPPFDPHDPLGMREIVAGIHAHLGTIAAGVRAPTLTRQGENENVWSVDIDPLPMTLVSGTFYVLDSPELLSPGLGEHWDIHVISATGFTAGSITGWVNLPFNAAQPALGVNQQAALRAVLSSAGEQTFGKMQCHLRPQDRITFVGVGITVPAGNPPLISLGATRVADPYWGRYLI